jgi:tetratricopeptide (TPR) repeat protein
VAAVREDARREARRALELDPHDGEAYLALELSLPTLSWRERELLVTQGVTADPGFEPLALMEGRLLLGVGRNRESVAWLESAHDLDHLHNSATWSLALSLASQGRGADSDALVNSMVAQWPAHDATHDARFWTSLVTGRTDLTLTLLGDPEARPRGMDHGGVDAWRRVLQAKGKRDPAASALVKAAAAKGSLSHGEALTLLAMAGDLEGAFDQARLYQPGSPCLPPYLFLPFTRSMREDPRFIPLAKRLGYVAYWRATGHWPDFCAETGLRYDCRAAADETRS